MQLMLILCVLLVVLSSTAYAMDPPPKNVSEDLASGDSLVFKHLPGDAFTTFHATLISCLKSFRDSFEDKKQFDKPLELLETVSTPDLPTYEEAIILLKDECNLPKLVDDRRLEAICKSMQCVNQILLNSTCPLILLFVERLQMLLCSLLPCVGTEKDNSSKSCAGCISEIQESISRIFDSTTKIEISDIFKTLTKWTEWGLSTCMVPPASYEWPARYVLTNHAFVRFSFCEFIEKFKLMDFTLDDGATPFEAAFHQMEKLTCPNYDPIISILIKVDSIHHLDESVKLISNIYLKILSSFMKLVKDDFDVTCDICPFVLGCHFDIALILCVLDCNIWESMTKKLDFTILNDAATSLEVNLRSYPSQAPDFIDFFRFDDLLIQATKIRTSTLGHQIFCYTKNCIRVEDFEDVFSFSEIGVNDYYAFDEQRFEGKTKYMKKSD